MQKPITSLSTEERKAIEARKSTSIARASTIELSQLLIYLFQLVGLNTDRYPSEMGRTILIDFIRTNYAGNTLDDVKLAFQMAAAGKLDIDDSGHYQNFSSAYFGKIMAAYRVWSSQVHEYTERALPPAEPEQEIIEMSDKDLLEATYQSYRIIKKHEFIPESVFSFLESEKMIDLTVEEKQQLKESVQKAFPEVTDPKELKVLCRKIAVARFFDYLIKSNVNKIYGNENL
jgi:hypothetical protein